MSPEERARKCVSHFHTRVYEDDVDDERAVDFLAAQFAEVQEETLDAVTYHHDVPDFRMAAIREWLGAPSEPSE